MCNAYNSDRISYKQHLTGGHAYYHASNMHAPRIRRPELKPPSMYWPEPDPATGAHAPAGRELCLSVACRPPIAPTYACNAPTCLADLFEPTTNHIASIC